MQPQSFWLQCHAALLLQCVSRMVVSVQGVRKAVMELSQGKHSLLHSKFRTNAPKISRNQLGIRRSCVAFANMIMNKQLVMLVSILV